MIIWKCKNCKKEGESPDNSVMIFCSRCEECVYEREGGDGNGIKNY
jgi:DNA-directed RNA polymerase subunit RPC12/RpoP